MKSILAALAVGYATLSLTGCVSSSKVQTQDTRSVGQQLQDLDKAYKEGIITQKEYDRLKKAIIKKND